MRSPAISRFVPWSRLLISQGVVDREALEAQYNLMRVHELEATIEEWFPPDIAAHLKEAIQEGGPDSAAADGPNG